MSLITSDYISSWYRLEDKNNLGNVYFVKSLSNTTSISAQPENAIQGDAGNIIIDIGGQKEETTISGDALLFESSDFFDVIDILLVDYRVLMHVFLFNSEYLHESFNYLRASIYAVGSVSSSDIVDLITRTTFSSFNTKWESITVNVSPISTRTSLRSRAQDLWKNLQPFKSTILLAYPINLYGSSYIINLFNAINSNEFNSIVNNIDLSVYKFDNTSLLTQAQINIGEEVNCTLNYQCKYTDKFNISVQNAGSLVNLYDFIARTAKNYDCRFYIDGNEYLIKSGNITISFEYSEIHIANVSSRIPFYSPQSYSVSGGLKIIARHSDFSEIPANDFQLIPTQGNCSLLIGDRYIELGQASIKSSYTRSLSPEEIQEIDIKFTAFARAGATISNTQWQTYMQNMRS